MCIDVYTTFCDFFLQILRKLFCFENLLDCSSSSTYVHSSECFFPFGCTTGSPTPPKNHFYRGRRIVGPGGPAQFAKKYYQNLRKHNTTFCEKNISKIREKILPKLAKKYYQNMRKYYQNMRKTLTKIAKNTLPNMRKKCHQNMRKNITKICEETGNLLGR